MRLTPLDIRKQEFKKSMRGYDTVEVDTFMDMMANEFEGVLKEQKELRDKTIELETELRDYRQVEKTLQQMLLQAQETTGKTFETARREADVIVREAESKAVRILEQANSDVVRLNNELIQLQARREAILGKLRVLLNTELEVLKSLDAGDRAPVVAPPPTKESIAFEDILKSLEDERNTKTH